MFGLSDVAALLWRGVGFGNVSYRLQATVAAVTVEIATVDGRLWVRGTAFADLPRAALWTDGNRVVTVFRVVCVGLGAGEAVAQHSYPPLWDSSGLLTR